MTQSQLLALGFSLGLLVGCSAQPQITQVSGTVTLDGQPVRAGRVIIVSADDRDSASGELTPEGTYQVINAPAGPVRLAVQVQPYRYTTVMGAAPSAPAFQDGGSAENVPAEVTGGMRPNPHFVAVPAKYEAVATSGLEATISSGLATHDIALSSTP